MTPVLIALLAATGVYLTYTSIGRQPQNPSTKSRFWLTFHDWMIQAGMVSTSGLKLMGLVGALLFIGALAGWIIFDGILAAALSGAFTATLPITFLRQRRLKRKAEAIEAWPRMIEEIRLLCGSLGRPIPQALIEVGKRGPQEMRAGFVAAEREWAMSTDFVRTTTVLKNALADPTADTICETLLVAHTIGGSDIDRYLRVLAEDRRIDLQGRKDAKAKQAGVRFARRFVLIVPLGMALAGMSIGNGRAAYQTADGQLGVALALLILATCWWWAGRLICLPEEQRVFRG